MEDKESCENSFASGFAEHRNNFVSNKSERFCDAFRR